MHPPAATRLGQDWTLGGGNGQNWGVERQHGQQVLSEALCPWSGSGCRRTLSVVSLEDFVTPSQW